MKNPALALSFALVTLPAGLATAQTQSAAQPLPPTIRTAAVDTSATAFRKLDADHDGKLSALEVNVDPKVAERFLQADKNHDGYLSLAEFKSLSAEPDMSVDQSAAQ